MIAVDGHGHELKVPGIEMKTKGRLENCEVTGIFPDDREYGHLPDALAMQSTLSNEQLAIQLWIDSLEMIISKGKFCRVQGFRYRADLFEIKDWVMRWVTWTICCFHCRA